MIRLSKITNNNGSLNKTFSAINGELVKTSNAKLYNGRVDNVTLSDLSDLPQFYNQLAPNQAVTLGHVVSLPDGAAAWVTTKGNETNYAVSRSKGTFGDRRGEPVLHLCDTDLDKAPDSIRQRITTPEAIRAALTLLNPSLATAGLVIMPSSSYGVRLASEPRRDTTQTSFHTYFVSSADRETMLKRMRERGWLYGLSFWMIGSDGKLHERSIVDVAVGSPERLVFEAPPTLEPGVVRDPVPPQIIAGGYADLPPELTPEEQEIVEMNRDEAKAQAEQDAMPVRAQWENVQIERMVNRGVPVDRARVIMQAMETNALLHDDFVLELSNGDLATVREIIENPQHYHGRTLPDPVEGRAYGDANASIILRIQPHEFHQRPRILSYAHGRPRDYYFARDETIRDETTNVPAVGRDTLEQGRDHIDAFYNHEIIEAFRPQLEYLNSITKKNPSPNPPAEQFRRVLNIECGTGKTYGLIKAVPKMAFMAMQIWRDVKSRGKSRTPPPIVITANRADDVIEIHNAIARELESGGYPEVTVAFKVGRDHELPDGTPICDRSEVAIAVENAYTETGISGFCKDCPFFETCVYNQNAEAIKQANIVVMTQAYMNFASPFGRGVTALIVDESPAMSLTDTSVMGFDGHDIGNTGLRDDPSVNAAIQKLQNRNVTTEETKEPVFDKAEVILTERRLRDLIDTCDGGVIPTARAWSAVGNYNQHDINRMIAEPDLKLPRPLTKLADDLRKQRQMAFVSGEMSDEVVSKKLKDANERNHELNQFVRFIDALRPAFRDIDTIRRPHLPGFRVAVESGNRVVKYPHRSKVHPSWINCPSIVTSATGNTTTIALYWRTEATEWTTTEIKPAWNDNVRVRQVFGQSYSFESLLDDDGFDGNGLPKYKPTDVLNELVRYFAIRKIETGADRALFIAQADVIETIKRQLPEGTVTMHFNATTGRNDARDLTYGMVVGRALPPSQEMERAAEAALFWQVPMTSGGYLKDETVGVNAFGQGKGPKIPNGVYHHPDPIADALLQETTVGECTQAIHRLRPILPKEQIVQLDVFNNLSLSMPVHQWGKFEDFEPPLETLVRHAGFDFDVNAYGAGRLLVAMFPGMFKNEGAVKVYRAKIKERQAARDALLRFNQVMRLPNETVYQEPTVPLPTGLTLDVKLKGDRRGLSHTVRTRFVMPHEYAQWADACGLVVLDARMGSRVEEIVRALSGGRYKASGKGEGTLRAALASLGVARPLEVVKQLMQAGRVQADGVGWDENRNKIEMVRVV